VLPGKIKIQDELIPIILFTFLRRIAGLFF